MAVKIYSRDKYNIYLTDNQYIVHNTRKDFQDGHTHIRSYDAAKYLVSIAIHKRIPLHLSERLLTSIVRLTEDEEYAEQIKKLIEVKHRKQTYVNRRCNQ